MWNGAFLDVVFCNIECGGESLDDDRWSRDLVLFFLVGARGWFFFIFEKVLLNEEVMVSMVVARGLFGGVNKLIGDLYGKRVV